MLGLAAYVFGKKKTYLKQNRAPYVKKQERSNAQCLIYIASNVAFDHPCLFTPGVQNTFNKTKKK